MEFTEREKKKKTATEERKQSLLKSVHTTQIHLGDNDEGDIPEHFSHCADCPSLCIHGFSHDVSLSSIINILNEWREFNCEKAAVLLSEGLL